MKSGEDIYSRLVLSEIHSAKNLRNLSFSEHLFRCRLENIDFFTESADVRYLRSS